MPRDAAGDARARGSPVEAPIKVLRAFGIAECDDESAEAADWLGGPDLVLVDAV